mmetsp:Transcript_22418/g.48398  ORF Transcript_22418/g.48398 Transcript_22418/m.48398 type:complete len:203 (-) Transcript_22418:651-1259(-)
MVRSILRVFPGDIQSVWTQPSLHICPSHILALVALSFSRSLLHCNSLAIFSTPTSQSPCSKTSRLFEGLKNWKPDVPVRPNIWSSALTLGLASTKLSGLSPKSIPMLRSMSRAAEPTPASSLLISSRMAVSGTSSTRPATGWTCNDVPMTMSRSHLGKSFFTSGSKAAGRASPKKVMSGFTSPEQPFRSQRGTLSANTASLT